MIYLTSCRQRKEKNLLEKIKIIDRKNLILPIISNL